MQIDKAAKYKFELKQTLSYIAKDKVSAMVDFRKRLNESLKLLKDFPYKYRKSIYFDNENIRDMIFEGYTVIYEVFEDKIEVMTIFNQNKPANK